MVDLFIKSIFNEQKKRKQKKIKKDRKTKNC